MTAFPPHYIPLLSSHSGFTFPPDPFVFSISLHPIPVSHFLPPHSDFPLLSHFGVSFAPIPFRFSFFSDIPFRFSTSFHPIPVFHLLQVHSDAEICLTVGRSIASNTNAIDAAVVLLGGFGGWYGGGGVVEGGSLERTERGGDDYRFDCLIIRSHIGSWFMEA